MVDQLFWIFLVLKLTDLIAWSWWWVFSPIWIWFLIVLVLASFGIRVTVPSNVKVTVKK